MKMRGGNWGGVFKRKLFSLLSLLAACLEQRGIHPINSRTVDQSTTSHNTLLAYSGM